MDFDAKFREKFSPHPSLFLPQNNHSNPRDDQFSLESALLSKGATNFLQDLHPLENFDLNLDLHGSSSTPNTFYPIHQPNCMESYDNSPFECVPNFDFYETKPFVNHATNNVALVPLIDNLNQNEGGIGVLGHSPMITPMNMISPNAQGYNPFCYYDYLGPTNYRPSDEDSCTTPVTTATLVPNRLSTTTVVRKGGREHRKKKSTAVKGQWSKEEDDLLIQLVDRYGVRKWSQIAQLLNRRVGKQCRERWHNHLKPDIKKDEWSEEEDRILIKAHTEIGNKWAEIAKLLPGRTENSIKNHWNATKRRQFSKRKCKSKYPRQSSLLQEYIKGLTLETINAGCRKKPLSYANHPPALEATTESPNDHPTGGSSNSSLGELVQPEYDFSEVPDFNFDAQMFEESSIDSLLDYAPPGDNRGSDGQGLAEIVNECQEHLGPNMMQNGVKMEFDLVQMINHVNL